MRLCHLIAIVLLALAVPAAAAEKPKPLSTRDAEWLLHSVPAAVELQQQGFNLGRELQTSSAFNQRDWFIFWAYNATRKCDGCSVTVGHFAVNRHTGEVFDMDLNSFVATPQLAAAQKMLRDKRRITQEVIRKHQSDALMRN